RQWESRTLPGYKKSPMIERSSGLLLFVARSRVRKKVEVERCCEPVADHRSSSPLAWGRGLAAGEQGIGATRKGEVWNRPPRNRHALRSLENRSGVEMYNACWTSARQSSHALACGRIAMLNKVWTSIDLQQRPTG